MADIDTLDRGPVTAADESEVQAIRRLALILEHMAESDSSDAARFVAPNGQSLDVPAPIYRALRQLVPALAEGDAVTVVRLHKEMTTQEAADFLNVSRPFLIKLLEEGTIPYTKVGTHRRVRFDDVLRYKQQRSKGRRELFAYMLAIAEEHGEYD